MNRKKRTDKEAIDKIVASFDTVDRLRREGLEGIRSLRAIKSAALERQNRRLSRKLGADHPRVRRIAERIESNRSLLKDLDVQIERSKTGVPEHDEKSWVGHGRVMDSDRKGVAGLRVALHDEKGELVRELGFSQTDKRGYFSITYSTTGEAKPGIDESTKLFLHVSDREDRILYRGKSPLYLRIGQVDYLEISLPREEEIPTPSGPGKVDVVHRTDTWIVEGQVTDEDGRGLPGFAVHMADSEGKAITTGRAVVTDDSGSFSVTVDARTARSLVRVGKDEVSLEISSESGEEVYRRGQPLKIAVGGRKVVEVVLNKEAIRAGKAPGEPAPETEKRERKPGGRTPPGTPVPPRDRIRREKAVPGTTELTPTANLLRIRGIGRRTAEKLIRGGIPDAETLLRTDARKLTRVIGRKLNVSNIKRAAREIARE